MIRVLTFFGTGWTFASSSNPYVFTIKDSDQQSNSGGPLSSRHGCLERVSVEVDMRTSVKRMHYFCLLFSRLQSRRSVGWRCAHCNS